MGPGDPCRGARKEEYKEYEVEIRNTTILQQSRSDYIESRSRPELIRPELRVEDAVAYGLLGQPAEFLEPEYTLEPLVLRVNQGDCLVVRLTNNLKGHASLNVGELIFDPQGSHGSAIGLNRDSTVPPARPGNTATSPIGTLVPPSPWTSPIPWMRPAGPSRR